MHKNGSREKNKNMIISVVIVVAFIMFMVWLDNRKEPVTPKTNEFSSISYKIPSYFEDSYSGWSYKSYRYSENSAYCTISINIDNHSSSATEVLENIRINLSDNASEIKKLYINNNQFYAVEVESSFTYSLGKIYYYAVESPDGYYLITYQITDYLKGDRNDFDKNKCFLAKDEFINSIVVK